MQPLDAFCVVIRVVFFLARIDYEGFRAAVGSFLDLGSLFVRCSKLTF